MKIASLETFPIVIPYSHDENSYLINRGGVSDVVLKITTDDGLVGWGEACMNSDTGTTLAAVQAAEPILLGRSPWDNEAIARDYFIFGGWQWQATTGSFAFAGVDMALWDLCGKACGQPIYRLFGGAMNERIDYFYYLAWGEEESLRRQCKDGLDKGYTTFYFKTGKDFDAEFGMLEIVRDAIGPDAKLRIDSNQAWSLPDAVHHLKLMHERFDLDFVEAPVRSSPIENLIEINRRTAVPVCANEGLWTEDDAARVIQRRAVDYLGFSPYFVGSLRRWQTLCHMADLNGLMIHKHTHGEFGLAAAAAQHILLTLPNVATGNQQTAQMMADDILTETLPIADGPMWGLIDRPGLGFDVDEDKVRMYHEKYLECGEFKPYGSRFQK